MDFLDHMLREVFRFTRNDLPWTGILSRMLREAFCWPEATRLDRGIWVSCRVRFRRPETTCLGRGVEFCVAWGFLFSRNDLFWKDVWLVCCVKIFRWPETSCFGRDLEACIVWGMCWLGTVPWQRLLYHMLREIFASHIARGFLWSGTTCPGRSYEL